VSCGAKIAIPAAAGAVALLAAGCGGGSNSAQHGSSGAMGKSGLSPIQAIALAATQAKQTTSFATDLSIKMTGSTAVSMSGSMALRSKNSAASSGWSCPTPSCSRAPASTSASSSTRCRATTRRLIMVEHGTGETVTVTLNVTGINQPVNVSLPPAGQVATIPASALSGK
jgi:hypothetical protein